MLDDVNSAGMGSTSAGGYEHFPRAHRAAPHPAAVPAPAIGLEKFVSVDGGVTFTPAPTPPGPKLAAPTSPQFLYIVTNDGNTPLIDLTLTDSSLGPFVLPPLTLQPNHFFVVSAEGTFAPGEQGNTATASGRHGTDIVSDADSAFYFGVHATQGAHPVIGSLLASIALQETAIAHLISAEAEKAQRLAAAMPTPSAFEDSSDMQKTILAIVNAVTLKQLIALGQVRRVVSIGF